MISDDRWLNFPREVGTIVFVKITLPSFPRHTTLHIMYPLKKMLLPKIIFVVFSCSFSVRPRFVAADCSIAPISLPLKNNTLADGVALNRGIPVQLGGQSEGFRVTFTKQNVLIRNGQDCILKGNVTNVSGCWGASGGVFNVDSSFKQAPDGDVCVFSEL